MRALLVILASTCCACASTGATPRPFPTPGGHPASTAPASLPNDGTSPTGALPTRTGGYEISGTALSLRGTPYRSGGTDRKGFDCSGLVWFVFAQHGLTVPRTVAEQFQGGSEIQPAELRPGDLVFFNTAGGGASHVGILVGGDSFVHAPASNGVVRVDRLGSTYWSARFIGAKRML